MLYRKSWTPLATIAGLLSYTSLPCAANAPTYSDAELLQFSLESANFQLALGQYGKQLGAEDFKANGFQPWVYERFDQIYEHTVEEVRLLNRTLIEAKAPAPLPCEYNFALLPNSSFFVQTVGSYAQSIGSAYIGMMGQIQDPTLRVVFGSLLSTHVRQHSWIYSAVYPGAAWSSPYDTPLDPQQVHSFLQVLTASCPSTNPELPFTNTPFLFVNLSPDSWDGPSGGVVQLTWDHSTVNATSEKYVLVQNGLGRQTIDLPSEANGTFTLPVEAQGWSFISLTTASDPQNVTVENTLAGPAYYHTEFDSKTANPGYYNPQSAYSAPATFA